MLARTLGRRRLSEAVSNPAIVRLVSSIAVAAIATAVLMLVLEVLSVLGAKELLEGVSHHALVALQALNPLDLGQRYLAHLSARISPCQALPSAEQAACWTQRHDIGFAGSIWAVVGSLFALLGDIFGESVTGAGVDLLQLIAGFWLAWIVMARLKAPPVAWTPALGILLGIAFTSLLSIPMLAIVTFAMHVAGEIVPAHSSLALFGGSWLGFMFACAGRTLEGGLHHMIGSAVERLLEK